MQTSRTLLAELACLPELINGKLAVINPDGTYSLYRVASWIDMKDYYNPQDYSLVKDSKWGWFIDRSKKEEIERHLVNKQLKKLRNKTYRVGDKIHIHSRRGIYEIVSILEDRLVITCKKWSYEDNPFHTIDHSDFKCLAGGLHNHSFE